MKLLVQIVIGLAVLGLLWLRAAAAELDGSPVRTVEELLAAEPARPAAASAAPDALEFLEGH